MDSRSPRSSWIASSIIAALIVVCAIVLIFFRSYLPLKPFNAQSQNISSSSSLLTAALPKYNAHIPGAPCDQNGGQWSLGLRHPDPQNKQQDVQENNVAVACQADGLLVTNTKHDQYGAALHFEGDMRGRTSMNGGSYTFPKDYRVQVDSAIQTKMPGTTVELSVQWQPTRYGHYSFVAGVDGEWDVYRYNSDDEIDKRLAIGFLHNTPHTITLAAEVHPSNMQFLLNGVLVAAVNDRTYTTTTSISMGISGPTDKGIQPAALFSNFSYQELQPVSTMLPNLGSALLKMQNTYAARVPGYNCDQGVGQWAPVSDGATALNCTRSALLISSKAGSKFLGLEKFYWYDGNFPANYRIGVQIDSDRLNNGCAGVETRTQPINGSGGYSYLVCQNGSWIISWYNMKGNVKELASGYVAASGSYSMLVAERGAQGTLMLNGVQVGSIEDKTYTETDHLALILSAPGGVAGFSNFSFTPLH